MTRSEAIERGDIRYNTGEACKHGHMSDRYTLNGACVECLEGRMLVERKRAHEIRARRAAEEAAGGG